MAIVITKDSIKNLKFEELVAWCKENNQVAWLKALPRTKEVKVYPKVDKVCSDGKVRQVYDKKQQPIGVKTIGLPYTELKGMFIDKFFPQFVTEKVAAPSMWDIIDSL